MNKKTQKLVYSGIMIALSTILSFITIYRLPYGGSVTLVSMLPIMIIGYIYGTLWGAFTGGIYGLIQALLGATTSAAFAGLSVGCVLAVLALDYLVAFGVLGFTSVFKTKIQNISASFGLGILLSSVLRYITHFVSGYIIYGSYAEWFFTQESVSFGDKILGTYSGKALAAVYSLIYNASYMIPEIIITIVVGVFIIKIPQINKILGK